MTMRVNSSKRLTKEGTMYSKTVKSYLRTSEGEAEALAFMYGWREAFNQFAEGYTLANVAVEFPSGSPNIHVVVYRGYYDDAGQEVWPAGQGE